MNYLNGKRRLSLKGEYFEKQELQFISIDELKAAVDPLSRETSLRKDFCSAFLDRIKPILSLPIFTPQCVQILYRQSRFSSIK